MEEKIRELVQAGLSRLIKETDIIWPGMDRQLPERNLSLYVAHELLSQGYTAMTEWPFNRNEHIDLVAYNPEDQTLVLVESKRAWGRSLELNWLCDDVERLERAAKGMDAWTSNATGEGQSIKARTVVGVVLVGSTNDTILDPEKFRRGQVNDVIRSLIHKVGKFDHVAHKDTKSPYVLHYAAWQIPVVA